MARNIILTGIPRSGTTLTCSLLNKIPNTLALVEPLDMVKFNACTDAAQRIRFLSDYFEQIRIDVASKKKISLLDIEGDGTNTFQYQENGARKTQIKGHREQEITKQLDSDFNLVIKHPNVFTALLKELKQHWDCYAIVRNPLSVFASWESLAHPLSNGHAPMAEYYDAVLKEKLQNTSGKLARQLILMNWYFETYLREINSFNVLRYEDIVSTSGAGLIKIVPDSNINEPLQSYNRRTVYSKEYMLQMMEVLYADKDGQWRSFYTEQDLLSVM
jgi:hypothetical protein